MTNFHLHFLKHRELLHFKIGAVKLVAADTLLAGAHQVDRLQPHVHRHVAFLKDGAAFTVKGLRHW